MADSTEFPKSTPGFVVLGVVIAILGVLTVVSSAYSQYQDERQDREAIADRDCLREQMVAIAEALEARSDPVSQRDDALEAWAKAVTKSQQAGEKALPRYTREQQELRNAKKDNKYPLGVCD
jgi:hypothetical protein